MAVVAINSGPISATDQLRNVPQEKWHDLMLARRQFMEIRLAHDCRCLVEFVNDAALMHSALGFANVEDMIREGYKLRPEEINVAVEWLRLNPPDQPVSLRVAVFLSKQEIGLGKAGPGRGHKTGSDTTRFSDRGRAYILARLDRDGYAALAAKVRAGKMSANAAAIEAGFRKPPATPFERILKLLPKLTAAQRRRLKEQL